MRRTTTYIPKFGGSQKRPGKNRSLYFFLALVLVVSLIAGGAVARYIRSSQVKGYAVGQEFYFSSDLLSTEGIFHTLNAGTQSFTIPLVNYADDLRFSEMDINFQVTVTAEKDSAGSVAVDKSTGTLTKNQASLEMITVSGLNNGGTYTVIVSTTNGYAKTLRGTFTVRQDGGVYQHIKDEGSYLLLTVWSEGYEGEVTITYDPTRIPDNTNPKMADWDCTNCTRTIQLEKHQTYEFRFFGSGAVNAKYHDKDVPKGTPH